MRFFRNILIWLLVIGATLASFVGFLVTYPPAFWWANELRGTGQGLLLELQRGVGRLALPHGLFVYWLALLLICAVIVLITLSSRPKRLRIERVVEGGRVLMSPQATKHYITTALAPFSDLACRKIALSQGRRGLEAIVYADLRTQDDVPQLERQLIERVHSALTSDLGIENVSKVNVVIREFGLPKGKSPNPVPAVPVPALKGQEVVNREPAAQAAPASATPSAAAAPAQSVVSVYPEPDSAGNPTIQDPGALSGERESAAEAIGEEKPGSGTITSEGGPDERKSDTPVL